jgi:cobalamin biosynthesis Mg chelatase CobN
MRLFGRKANQQSTKRPDVLDVPPELRPYYREQAVVARTRHAAVRVTTALLILALVTGGGAWLWMHRHGVSSTVSSRIATITDWAKKKQQSKPSQNKSQKSQSQKKTTADNNKQQAAPSQPSTTQQPNKTPSQSSGGTSGSGQTGQQQTQQTSQPPATTAPSGNTPIPNTGPGTTILFSALGVGLLGGAIHHIRQRRAR